MQALHLIRRFADLRWFFEEIDCIFRNEQVAAALARKPITLMFFATARPGRFHNPPPIIRWASSQRVRHEAGLCAAGGLDEPAFPGLMVNDDVVVAVRVGQACSARDGCFHR